MSPGGLPLGDFFVSLFLITISQLSQAHVEIEKFMCLNVWFVFNHV